MRETIGEVKCRFHRRAITADVRKDKNGKLYYHCRECGPVIVHGRSFQSWITEKATIYGAKEQAA